MAESNKTSREIARSNSCVFPRDLLQRFISNSADGDQEDEEEDEEIELNLGLSLGGRFGVDKSNKLLRSSSVVVTIPLFRETHQPEPTTKPPEASVAVARHAGLKRTTSLPAESEEEWRKRKEMQTLRRMAAKRRRSEKLRTGGGGGGSSVKSTEGDNSNPGEAATASRRRGRPSSGLPRWSATANKGGLLRQHSAGHDSLQGSLESQGGSGGGGGGGSCSSVSEMETKSHQASSEEARSVPSTQQQQEALTRPNTRLRRLSSVDMKIEPPQGKGKNEMPCVFTKGDGPNGKRVDGILYRYGNGEEVRIMCVCHGDFLSPADFVKHAGGPHVDHPLRHIVVNTSSPSNLL